MPGGPSVGLLCRASTFAALVADGQPPGAAVEVVNDVWVSTNGSRWRLQGVLDEPIFLSDIARAGNRWLLPHMGRQWLVRTTESPGI
jgi:hypothetical protein